MHNMRNIFNTQELYITKNKYNKIIDKHSEVKDILDDNSRYDK